MMDNLCEFTLPRDTIFGDGALKCIGDKASKLGDKALLTIGRGSLRKSGALDKTIRLLRDSGIEVTLYEGIENDPCIQTIDNGCKLCLKNSCDLVIGVGGGSVLDAGKLIAILATNPGSAREYQMGDKTIKHRGLPYVAIPTTSGTGSEGNKVAVVTNKEEQIKKSIAHTYMAPVLAIVDPYLTVSVPPKLTAIVGIDALSHAMESYVSLNAQPFTEGIGLRAIELIGESLPRAFEQVSDISARSNLAMASYLAGISLNAGVGTAHMLAHPLGALFKIAHGEAVALVLIQFMRKNLDYATEKFAKIAIALGEDVHGLPPSSAAELSIKAVSKLYHRIGLTKSLEDFGVKEKNFRDILEGVEKSTSHIITNPRPVTKELLVEILRASM